MGKLIQNNIKYWYADVKVSTVFTPSPFASFCTASNLRCHLVRSKLYQLERKTGWLKCRFKRCLTCKNVQECYTLSRFDAKESFKISGYFDCISKYLIYLMSCKVCVKQYAGSTPKRFRFWWDTNMDNQRKAKITLRSLFMNTF